MNPVTEDDFEGWYALCCHTRREKTIVEDLTERNLNTYLPMERRVVTHARRSKLKSFPLIPGYVFVEIKLKGDFYKARTVVGVDRILAAADGRPRRLIEENLDVLRRIEQSGTFNQAFEKASVRAKFKTGQRVKIVDGPFHGRHGVVDRGGERKQFDVLVWLFGQETRTTVDAAQLKAA